MEKIRKIIIELMVSKFYGTITIKFQNGKPVLVDTNRSQKI